jgi:hypothetical protein
MMESPMTESFSQRMGRRARNTLVGVSLVGSIGIPTWNYFATDTVQARINEIQTKRYDDGDKYIIMTTAGVFENTDAWYRLKFNSSDVQNEAGSLRGKEVEIRKYGWRVRPFSWYENVVEITPK